MRDEGTLKPGQENKMPPPVKAERVKTTLAVVNIDYLNYRKSARAVNGNVIGQLMQGDKVEVIGIINGDWYKVFVGDIEAYVMKKFVTNIDDE